MILTPPAALPPPVLQCFYASGDWDFVSFQAWLADSARWLFCVGA